MVGYVTRRGKLGDFAQNVEHTTGPGGKEKARESGIPEC